MKKGFTLIELGIVLVVVGLLTAGVLIGQSLISSAKVGRVIRDIQQYTIAVNNFKSTYRQWPGDYNRTSFAGCNINSSYPCNGNGDGCIQVFTSAGAGSFLETYLAWQHLENTGMINNLKLPRTTNYGGRFAMSPGDNMPASSYAKNAGYSFSSPWAACSTGVTGWWPNEPDGSTLANKAKVGFLLSADNASDYTVTGTVKPADALSMDKKMDDAVANAGLVRSENSYNGVGGITAADHHCTTVVAGATYNTAYTETTHGCRMWFGVPN